LEKPEHRKRAIISKYNTLLQSFVAFCCCPDGVFRFGGALRLQPARNAAVSITNRMTAARSGERNLRRRHNSLRLQIILRPRTTSEP
jgi:hypothetical protein